MELPTNKTKLICTIGPASDHPDTLAAMLRAGMNVARLNFSHGDEDQRGQFLTNASRITS